VPEIRPAEITMVRQQPVRDAEPYEVLALAVEASDGAAADGEHLQRFTTWGWLITVL
jgi:hypothetical protein